MKAIYLRNPALLPHLNHFTKYLLFGSLLLLWIVLPTLMQFDGSTNGSIDPSIWLLVLLAIISFLILLVLCWWLLKQFWMALGLPSLKLMVSHFNFLELWQQLGFYFACFALLLLSAIGCLAAVL